MSNRSNKQPQVPKWYEGKSDEFVWEYFVMSHQKNTRKFLNWLASEGYMYTPDGPVPIPPIRRPAKRNPVTNPIIGDTP